MCMKLSPTKLGSTYFQATRLTTKSNGVIFNCSSVIIKIAMKKNQSMINNNGGLTTVKTCNHRNPNLVVNPTC